MTIAYQAVSSLMTLSVLRGHFTFKPFQK